MQENQDPSSHPQMSSKWHLTPIVSHVSEVILDLLAFPEHQITPFEAGIPPPPNPQSHESNKVLLF